MTPEERRNEIINMVRTETRASVEQLAEALNASRETIRRDLSELDSRGFLRKVHGGAVISEPDTADSLEGPFSARMAQNLKAKRAIAKAAAGLLKAGDSVLIDTGSTTLVLAEELSSIAGLTVITNSAAIAALAAKGPESKVFLIGGEYRRSGQENVGEIAVQQISQFRAMHAILTVAAVAETGYMDHDFQEAQVARAMSRQAASVTILADSSKMGRLGVFEVGPPQLAKRLITNEIPDDLAGRFRASGVDITMTPQLD